MKGKDKSFQRIAIAAAIYAMTGISLSGCGKSNNYNADDYTKQVFERDGSTISDATQKQYNEYAGVVDDTVYSGNTSSEGLTGDSEANRIATQSYNEDTYTAEVTIENASGEAAYTVNGNDVIYNGVTYSNLYVNALKCESPYSTEDFINFILYLYPAPNTGDMVYTVPYIVSEEEGIDIPEGADSNVSVSLEDGLSESADYMRLVDKYNDHAAWSLEIYQFGGKDKLKLVGCKSFIASLSSVDDVVVDLSDMDLTNKTSTNAVVVPDSDENSLENSESSSEDSENLDNVDEEQTIESDETTVSD
jgi:hypothetical protein